MKLLKSKKVSVAVGAVALTGILAACGSKDPSEMRYLADFKASDYVILGDYMGVEFELADPEVTDEYLEGYIAYSLMNDPEYTPVTDRSVKSGDKTIIDFEGRIDGETFEGGTASGYELVIGSGGFIDGFEDGMIGMEIGETRDLELAFPDPYSPNPDLSGVPVVFTVTVHSIEEPQIPELTDEYVAELGLEGCSTVEEYRQYLREGLQQQAQADYETARIDAAVAAVEENSVAQDPPSGMVDRISDTLTGNAEAYAQMYGVDMGTYVSAVYGGEAEKYQETIREQATQMAQTYITLGAVAEKEKIKVTDDELDESISGEDIDKEAYREYLLAQKTAEFIAENAVVTSPASE